jgi:hypothetical protein
MASVRRVEQAQQSVARANSGSLHTRSLADGTRVFRLRFNAVGRRELMSLHERPGCDCGCGSGWDEPAARRELGDAIARVRLGVWKRPTAASRKRRAGTGTSFEDYALRWLQAKTDGLFGEIAPATAADYRWCIERHLLPIFGDCTVEEIDRARCLRLKARLLSDARELREALAAGREMRDERGRRRRPLGPTAYLVPNMRGGRMDRGRVARILTLASGQASEQLTAKGLPPLPNTTPHTLRRTYISIALLANEFDVKWVMGQVGHADSRMTMDVYAQLEQRAKRSHGTSFDRLVRQAHEQHGDPATAAAA